MYNFGLMEEEQVINIFDDIWVCQGNNEKNTTIALTNKRILFLDYDESDPNEVLRIARGAEYPRYKEVYYQINMEEISDVKKGNNYTVYLSNNTNFEFDNDHLFQTLREILK